MRHACFLVLTIFLTACSTLGTTSQLSTLPAPTAATQTIPIALPQTIPTTIPAACLRSDQVGDWPARADSNDWSAKVVRDCLVSPSREEVIRVLFAIWMAHFEAATIPNEYRIEKFEIVAIEEVQVTSYGPDKTPVDFSALVTYSVEPTLPLSSNPGSWWVAGDGSPSSFGWVLMKKDDVVITTSGNYFQMNLAPHGAE